MINNFGKGTILKGSDCDLAIAISSCCQRVDIDNVRNFSCAFYTEDDGQAVMKYKDDFEFEDGYGIVHFQGQELDQLPDGVVRYTMQYDNTTIERNTNYYLKTPIGYTPMDFVSRDEVDGVIASALTSSAGTELIDTVVQGLGFTTEEYVNDAVVDCYNNVMSAVSETISDNDWRYVVRHEHGGVPGFWQSEIDAAVNAALAQKAQDWPKMTLYYPVNTSSGPQYLEFRTFYNYSPYTDHEVYFWGMIDNGSPGDFSIILLGLDRGQIPDNSNVIREDYELGDYLTQSDFKTINGESIVGVGDIQTDNYTFYIDNVNDLGAVNSILDKATELGEEFRKIRVIVRGFTDSRCGHYSPIVFNGSASPMNMSLESVSFLYMNYDSFYLNSLYLEYDRPVQASTIRVRFTDFGRCRQVR